MKQEELIKNCSALLFKLCDEVKRLNSLNYYDINISSEYFFIPLLNCLFESDFTNKNTEKKNAASIDLYDSKNRIAVQVTSDCSAEKIHNTIKKYREAKQYLKFDRLIFVVIVKEKQYRADFSNDTQGLFPFEKDRDIYTIEKIINLIQSQPLEKLSRIHEYLQFQLGTALDNHHIWSPERAFNEISSNTCNLLNENYFSIDEEQFVADFYEKIENQVVLHFTASSKEEGMFCLLALLLSDDTKKAVYIFRDKNSWDAAKGVLINCIVIPFFVSEEISALENNTTLFIDSTPYDISKSIPIPRRTKRFLIKKLEENGYKDAYRLIQETQGVYYYIKRKLFTGEIQSPPWCNKKSKAIIIAGLVGQWIESDGDKELIEKLYSDKYETFIQELKPFVGDACAFLVQRHRFSTEKSFLLSDTLFTWQSIKEQLDDNIIKEFLDTIKPVIISRDPLFDEPFEQHYYLANQIKSKYSKSIKEGCIKSLVFLALYNDKQQTIDFVVDSILNEINNLKDWANIAQFFELLCEASPSIVLNRINQEFEKETGLFDLFTVEEENKLFARHYYTNILWGLEKLLLCKDFVCETVHVLLKLGERVEHCSINNSPREILERVFCYWHNCSVLSVQEKKDFVAFGTKNYSYFWNLIFTSINDHKSIFCSNSRFFYRSSDECIPYTNQDLYELYNYSVEQLLINIGTDIENTRKILCLLPHCREHVFKKIDQHLHHYLCNSTDNERELIKTDLRKILYNHQYFANSDWATTEERKNQIKNCLLGISFDDRAFDYLYLSKEYQPPIIDPIVYIEGDKQAKEEEKRIDEYLNNEFDRFNKEGIGLNHYLELVGSDANPFFGNILAKYYSRGKFEQDVFSALLSYSSMEVTRNYVLSSIHTNEQLMDLLNKINNSGHNREFFVELLTRVPLSYSIAIIDSLNEEEKHLFWQKKHSENTQDKTIIEFQIKNYLKYESFQMLLWLLYESSELIPYDELIDILTSIIEKLHDRQDKNIAAYSFLFQEIMEKLQHKIRGNYSIYPTVAQLEIQLFGVLKGHEMVCLKHLLSTNARYFSDLVFYAYKSDVSDKAIDPQISKRCYEMMSDIHFCPGVVDEKINSTLLNQWVDEFQEALKTQGQLDLLQLLLAKVFVFSPKGIDGYIPDEQIRNIIERIGDLSFDRSFAIELYNRRGVYGVTDGKAEKTLSEKYKNIANAMKIKYPKTSKAYQMLGEMYDSDSKYERLTAEEFII